MKERINDSTPLSILVVEDNPGDFFLIEEYIEEMFFDSKITHVTNFSEAEAILSKNDAAFDSILLDATLPDSDGLQLISDVVLLANQAPVIVLTGHESLDFSMNSLSLGVSEYLLKDEINASLLHKSILFSIERRKHRKTIEESEKRYSELFHLSPIPMWVYETENFRIKQVNFAAIQHYGYSEEEFLAMSIVDLIPQHEVKSKRNFQENRSHDEAVILHHVLKNGRRIKVRIEQTYLTLDGHPCCVMLSNDITLLIETQDSLRAAYKNIIEIEEKEKERFAAELHDGLQQNIVAAKLIFSFLAEQSPSLAAEPRAIQLNQTLQGALDECSQIIHEVRPKGIIENGFNSEIEALIEKIKATGNVEVTFSSIIDIDSLFGYFDLMHIYRITQELFNNAIKHANATRLELIFSLNNNQLELIFKDDGKGISQEVLDAKSTFISLKRRVQILNASINVVSELNKGTSIHICVPLNT